MGGSGIAFGSSYIGFKAYRNYQTQIDSFEEKEIDRSRMSNADFIHFCYTCLTIGSNGMLAVGIGSMAKFKAASSCCQLIRLGTLTMFCGSFFLALNLIGGAGVYLMDRNKVSQRI